MSYASLERVYLYRSLSSSSSDSQDGVASASTGNHSDDSEIKAVSIFECPICSRYMFPPIRQCSSGHCYCNGCFDNIQKCVFCRAPKTKARCYILENIHALLSFPCKYQEDGCDFRARYKVIKEHEMVCKVPPMLCPLRFNVCHWRGSKHEIVAHCHQEHADKILFNTSQELVATAFDNPMDRNCHIIFCGYDNLFRYSFSLDMNTRLVRFAVYCLGQYVECNKFSFELKRHHEEFIPGKYLVSCYDLLKEFCNREGDLNYHVEILKDE